MYTKFKFIIMTSTSVYLLASPLSAMLEEDVGRSGVARPVPSIPASKPAVDPAFLSSTEKSKSGLIITTTADFLGGVSEESPKSTASSSGATSTSSSTSDSDSDAPTSTSHNGSGSDSESSPEISSRAINGIEAAAAITTVAATHPPAALQPNRAPSTAATAAGLDPLIGGNPMAMATAPVVQPAAGSPMLATATASATPAAHIPPAPAAAPLPVATAAPALPIAAVSPAVPKWPAMSIDEEARIRQHIDILLEGKNGFTKNLQLAARLIEQYANAGFYYALDLKIEGLVEGRNGFAKDLKRAAALIEQYANAGVPGAMFSKLYGVVRGKAGFAKDLNSAVQLIGAAAVIWPNEALNFIGRLCEDGVDKDLPAAAALNDRLADFPWLHQRSAVERKIDGLLEGQHGYAKDLVKAAQLINQQADGGYAKAMGLRIEGFLEGKNGFIQDFPRAVQLVDALAVSDEEKGVNVMGEMLVVPFYWNYLAKPKETEASLRALAGACQPKAKELIEGFLKRTAAAASMRASMSF